MTSIVPAETRRRRQLLEAAGRLFRANGFRAVTMEAIAAEAGVAKATLYSHFPNKTAIFAAVADAVTRQVADALQAELARTGGVDERIARGLIARHKTIYSLVDGSAHARELMNTRDDIARTSVARVDSQMIGALVAALREDAVFAKSAESIAKTLFKGCVGVAGLVRSVADVETEVGNFVRPYLAGLRALAEQQAHHPEVRRATGSGRR
jgi:AcrR family transcriptional regulator